MSANTIATTKCLMTARRCNMKGTAISMAVVLLAFGSGCTLLDRSRDIGNPAVTAQTLALQVCSNCHGADGNATSPNFPNLSAQQEAYFIAQLNGFKSHNRSDPAGFEYMWGLSKRLSDDQIKALAAYYAIQKPAPRRANDSRAATEGKVIFESGVESKNIPACSTCHGANGEGKDQYPRLANQHADYLVKQLTVFQRTDARPEGGVMKTIAHELTRDDMTAVATYLEAMPQK